jgi:cysteine synthase A
MKIFENLESAIGGTPLFSLSRIEQRLSLSARLFAKAEGFNPAGSAKDRVALQMILGAEARGEIAPGDTLIEPTSGNTGIGLCAIGAARGYRVCIVMPDSMSKERRLLMEAYGAEVVLTPGALGMKGAIAKAEELKEKTPRAFIPSQFDNPDNAEAHYRTTGPEIFSAMDGKIDAFVAGIGTGGTITGTGRYLKEHCESIRIVAAEPAASPLLSGGTAGAHGLQGMGANFIPKVLDQTIYDEVLTVTEDEAYEMARLLATCEGLLCGISSGAALSAAVKLAKREEMKGKSIVLVLPDSGERYLSTPLYCKE